MLPMVAHALDLSGGVLAIVERAAEADRLIVRQVNGAFCRAFGAEAAALEGQPFAALAAPEEGAKLQALAAAAARGEAHRSELACVRPNGSRLWLGLHLMPADPASHQARLFVMLARDITAPRREAEQQNAVQRLLATVFAAAETGLAIVGQDGRFLMTNAAHDRMLGYEPGALAGRPSADFLAPESREAVRLARAQQLVDAKRYAVDASLLAADGTHVPVMLVSGVVSPSDRERYRVVTVIPRGPAQRPAAPLQVHLTGKIRLITLEDVKATLGDRWESMVERVMDSAERIVARQMAPGDTFFRTKDHGFVVCYPSASEEEATFRAAALAREIRHRLIGTGEDPETVEVSAVVAAVPVPAGPGGPGNAALDRSMAEVEQQLRAEARLPPGARGFVFERVIGREQGPLLGHYVRAQWPGRGAGGITALPPDRLEADLATLRFAERVAVERSSGGEALFVEIDFDCFFSRQKTLSLLDVCQGLSPDARGRVVLLMGGMTENVASSRVLDSVQRLRPFCRAVGFVLDAPDLRTTDVLVTAGTFVLLNAHAWDRTPALANARITKLAAGLHARKSSLMARGVDIPAAREALRDCGVNLFVVAGAPG
jgi:PAS domain S-box-containing protein